MTGSALAIDVEATASVKLDGSGEVRDSTAEAPDADVHLVECCIGPVIEVFGDGEGGTVGTENDLSIAVSLKNSSVAANATVLATFSAFGRSVGPGPDADISRLGACRMSVRAAREVGVTTTGVLDDTAASIVGGVVVTDDIEDGLVTRDEVDWDVLVWASPERAYSADADVSRCGNVVPMVDLVANLALEDRYAEAVTIDGLAFSIAPDFPADPAVEAMPIADGVLLSGTGPNVIAIGSRADPERVKELWDVREGKT